MLLECLRGLSREQIPGKWNRSLSRIPSVFVVDDQVELCLAEPTGEAMISGALR